MGCDISEQYYFAGSVDGVKKFHDFLKPFEYNDEFEAFLKEKYPIDKSKLNNTSFGFQMAPPGPFVYAILHRTNQLKVKGFFFCNFFYRIACQFASHRSVKRYRLLRRTC